MKRILCTITLLMLVCVSYGQNIFTPQFFSVGDTINLDMSKVINKSTVFDFETRKVLMGGLYANGAGEITGAVTLGNTLEVAGATTLSNLSITGNLTNANDANACFQFSDSSVTVTISKAGAWTRVTNVNDSLFTFLGDSINFAFENDTVFVGSAGVYNLDLRLTVGIADTSAAWKVGVAKGDTSTILASTIAYSDSAMYPSICTFSQYALTADDTLFTVIKNINETDNAVVRSGALRLTKIRP